MIEIKLQQTEKLAKFFIPEKWEEIPAKVLLQITPALYRDNANSKIEILKLFVPNKARKLFFKLDAENVYSLTQLLDWLFETPITSPLIPFFKLGLMERVYLPSYLLEDMTMLQLAFVDAYFEKIVGGEIHHLDDFVSCICKPKGEVFDEDKAKARLPKIKKLSINEKLFCLLFFSGNKQLLAERYPVLFRKREEDTSENKMPDYKWVGVIWQLAGNLANEKEIQNKNIHNVLGYLCYEHYQKIENGKSNPM
jgi:hypothetical protein